ncbi:MAG: hypothetical protein B6I20_09475 [Bacteroidetes bacterium 4572_117]|nr:MAG: hypothetical protein B6I20_09475 [Bacteroidetes bacterium 4572_117]
MVTRYRTQKDKKSIIWPYLLAGAVFVFGIIYMIYLIFDIVEDYTDLNHRFVAPCNKEVVELEAGGYTVYHEYKTYFEDVYFDTRSSINGLKVQVQNQSDNKEIVVKNSTFNSTYSTSDVSGAAILMFEIEKKGKYIVESSFVDAEHEKVVLSIGKTMGFSFVNSVFGVMGVLLGSILLSILIAIFGAKWEKNRNSI